MVNTSVLNTTESDKLLNINCGILNKEVSVGFMNWVCLTEDDHS